MGAKQVKVRPESRETKKEEKQGHKKRYSAVYGGWVSAEDGGSSAAALRARCVPPGEARVLALSEDAPD